LTRFGALTRRWSGDVPPSGRAIVAALVVALVTYAAFALVARWWLSGLAAPVVAVLLAVRHARARFAAYIFFTLVALRGFVGRRPLLVVFAVAAVLVLQLRPARRAWPSLTRRPGA